MKKITLLIIASFLLSNGMMAQNKSKFVYELAPLPYAYNALEKAIDSTTMAIHYSRHHKAYFDNFLKAIEGTDMAYLTMEEMFANISKLPVAVRNNGGGHYNHSLFWSVMTPKETKPEGKLLQAIESTFGSVDAFKKEFEKAGATRFGSGWAWLSVNDKGELFVSSTANQDNPLMDIVAERGTPILGLDVWEHAYYLRYQNKRAGYMSAFWSVVNWDEVARRYDAARK